MNKCNQWCCWLWYQPQAQHRRNYCGCHRAFHGGLNDRRQQVRISSLVCSVWGTRRFAMFACRWYWSFLTNVQGSSLCLCVLLQGADRNQIIEAVSYGKERPGTTEDVLIPQVQMVTATCWKEDPKERMKPLYLLALFSASQVGKGCPRVWVYFWARHATSNRPKDSPRIDSNFLFGVYTHVLIIYTYTHNMHIHTYICTYLYTHTRTHSVTRTHNHIHACKHAHTHICTR